MKPVVTSDFIRQAEKKTIEKIGISAELLMENAGRFIAQYIHSSHLENEHTATIFCGKGNNGGDGLVVGRILAELGWQVQIILLFKPESLSELSKLQLNRISNLTKLDEDLTLTVSLIEDPIKIINLNPTFVVIDAVLGTGSNQSELLPIISTAIEWMNSSFASVYAIDIPTGLNPDTGLLNTVCTEADLTFSLGAIKQGLLLHDGPLVSGRVITVDIGIPNKLLGATKKYLNSEQIFPHHFFEKLPTINKYESGHVVVIAGSKGMHGAAVLAAKSALRSGAGLVTVLTEEDCYVPVASQVSEIMVVPIRYSTELLDNEQAIRIIEKADVLVLGPGLGRKNETIEMVRLLLSSLELPIVLDADALFAYNQQVERLSQTKSALVMTPHFGEFAKLIGKDYDEILPELLDLLTDLSESTGQTVLLKGRYSIIVNSMGDIVFNPTGNPGMATAGSGDVLSGVIGSFIAQGLYLDTAAAAAAFFHGLAGDIAAEKFSQTGMTAEKIIECFPDAVKKMIARTND